MDVYLLLCNYCFYIQKFKVSGLLAHEKEIDQLQEEGEHLIETQHPGSATISVSLFFIHFVHEIMPVLVKYNISTNMNSQFSQDHSLLQCYLQ